MPEGSSCDEASASAPRFGRTITANTTVHATPPMMAPCVSTASPSPRAPSRAWRACAAVLRRQPPDEARRRRIDEGQPRRWSRRCGGSVRGCLMFRRRRRTRSSSSTMCWPRASSWCCLTTSRYARCRSRYSDATPAPGKKLESSSGLTLDTTADTGHRLFGRRHRTHSVRSISASIYIDRRYYSAHGRGIRERTQEQTRQRDTYE
jgi:hypothetical protein